MLQNLYSKLLCVKFASNWINFKQVRKGVSMASPTSTYLTSKKAIFCKVPQLIKFEIKLNKP